MEINNELKEIDTKNGMSYYFDGIIKNEDSDFNNILLNQISNKQILIYEISSKTLIGEKSIAC